MCRSILIELRRQVQINAIFINLNVIITKFIIWILLNRIRSTIKKISLNPKKVMLNYVISILLLGKECYTISSRIKMRLETTDSIDRYPRIPSIEHVSNCKLLIFFVFI